MSKLSIDLKVGEVIRIGDTSIRLEKKSGQLARLVIEAGPETAITTPARMSVPTNQPPANANG